MCWFSGSDSFWESECHTPLWTRTSSLVIQCFKFPSPQKDTEELSYCHAALGSYPLNRMTTVPLSLVSRLYGYSWFIKPATHAPPLARQCAVSTAVPVITHYRMTRKGQLACTHSLQSDMLPHIPLGGLLPLWLRMTRHPNIRIQICRKVVSQHSPS